MCYPDWSNCKVPEAGDQIVSRIPDDSFYEQHKITRCPSCRGEGCPQCEGFGNLEHVLVFAGHFENGRWVETADD